MDEYYQAASALPQPLAGTLAALSPRIAPFVQEIRLRVGQGVQFTVQGQLSPAGKYLPELNEKISEETLKNCFLQLCRHSVYAYEDELSRGYFTLPGGSRVGVAGCRGGRGFGRVTSLNLRIARPVLCSLPKELTDFLAAPTGGVLVVGVPGSGKTTFLRSILQYLIEQRQIVAVADERGELTGVDCKGKMLVSPGCDVYTRCSKAAAVEMSLRCMNPRFILCDELGTAEDAAALEWGVASGVVFAASVHCESLRALQKRPQLARLLQTGAFARAVLLAGGHRPGEVAEWKTLCYALPCDWYRPCCCARRAAGWGWRQPKNRNAGGGRYIPLRGCFRISGRRCSTCRCPLPTCWSVPPPTRNLPPSARQRVHS